MRTRGSPQALPTPPAPRTPTLCRPPCVRVSLPVTQWLPPGRAAQRLPGRPGLRLWEQAHLSWETRCPPGSRGQHFVPPPGLATDTPPEHRIRHAGHFCPSYPWGPGILGCPVHCRRTQGPGSTRPRDPAGGGRALGQAGRVGAGRQGALLAAPGVALPCLHLPTSGCLGPGRAPARPLCPLSCGPIVRGVSVRSGRGDCLWGLFHPPGPRRLGLMPAALAWGDDLVG